MDIFSRRAGQNKTSENETMTSHSGGLKGVHVQSGVGGRALWTQAEGARVFQDNGALGAFTAVVVCGGETQATHPVLAPPFA